MRIGVGGCYIFSESGFSQIPFVKEEVSTSIHGDCVSDELWRCRNRKTQVRKGWTRAGSRFWGRQMRCRGVWSMRRKRTDKGRLQIVGLADEM